MTTITNISIADRVDLKLDSGQVAIWWLGQAGFLIKAGNRTCVVDAYLSDSLAEKYKDAEFKHIRMMPVPVSPSELVGIDWIFSSHCHTDHMDTGTLPELLSANPDARYFFPKSATDHVRDVIGFPEKVTNPLRVGDHVQLSENAWLDVVASAHESLEYNDAGDSFYLGFILNVNGVKIYHSGDCAPYDGLGDVLKDFGIDLAILPVNGRGKGVAGNFTFEEAVELCESAGILNMMACHFGMFDFNTVEPSELRKKIGKLNGRVDVVLPEIDKAALFNKDKSVASHRMEE